MDLPPQSDSTELAECPMARQAAKETRILPRRDRERGEKISSEFGFFRLCELCVSVVKFLYYSRLFVSIRG